MKEINAQKKRKRNKNMEKYKKLQNKLEC